MLQYTCHLRLTVNTSSKTKRLKRVGTIAENTHSDEVFDEIHSHEQIVLWGVNLQKSARISRIRVVPRLPESSLSLEFF